MPIMCGGGSFGLFVQALQSALNTFLHLITMFSAYNWFTAEKERVSGLFMSQRKVGKRREAEKSIFQPHEERLVRRICGH